MHDPMTLICDFPSYRFREKHKWAPHLFTLWHVDPEHDGSDNSCDWFGGKNLDPDQVKKVEEMFLFESRDDGTMSWFGDGKYAPELLGVGISMFRIAANVYFGHWSPKAERFLRLHTFEIIRFIDNSCDSINSSIREAKLAKGEDRKRIIKRLARIVLSWVARENRPWYRHPRWHFWHWRIQFHPWQQLKRRWWDKCCVCGKRGFKNSAIGSWSGDQIWHSECDNDHPARVAKAEVEK